MAMNPANLLAFFCLWIVVESAEHSVNLTTLRFIQTLCRHGDRNPASSFPSDTANNESTWEGGLGELTKLGILQTYSLGQFLKKRYTGFLSPDYNAREIHARSSGFNRTIASALSILAGLYQPSFGQMVIENLPWIPIPVHSKPRYDDPVLWMNRPCPRVEELHQTRVMKSREYMAIEKANEEFLEYIRQKTGRESMRFLDMWDVFDPLFCQAIHNDSHTWPDWVNNTVFNKIEHLYKQSLSFYYHLPEIQRLRGSLLFNEVASRMMDKIQQSSNYIQNLKHYLYSLHDTTQIGLLENLGGFDGIEPTYAQLLVFELHELDGKFYVELNKRNNTETDDVVPIPIPVCGSPCLAEKLAAISAAKVPSDWYKECGLTESLSRPKKKKRTKKKQKRTRTKALSLSTKM